MKKYNQNHQLSQVICNQCGKSLHVEKGVLMDGMLEVKQNFGYFSSRDGVTHAFDLCEECYEKLIKGFQIPVEEKEEFEWQVGRE